jgi:thioredoxin reductase
MYDVIIVGGGPAGLSAALVLGRARRRVLVCDAGSPRNAASRAMHGFLTRDGIPPQELLCLGREELARYGVQVLPVRVVSACCLPASERHGAATAFQVALDNQRTLVARKLLLATGMADVLPEIEGIREYYGKAVHHCPYCDGWEHRDQQLAALGNGRRAVGLAMLLRTWSEHVTACTNGVPAEPGDRQRLARSGIALREERLARLEGTADVLQRIVFTDGPPLACDALFFNTDQVQRSNLPAMLGCQYTETGHVRVRHRQRTRVPGVYLAGDAGGEVQFAIVAAGKGAVAAVAINRELQDEDRGEARS